MQRILGGDAVTSESIAEAVEVLVSDATNPVELHALGDAGHDWAMVYQLTGGSLDPATLYRLQPSPGAESMPYIVDSNDGGYSWVAIAGRFMANSLDVNDSISSANIISANNYIEALQQVRSKNVGAAAIQLDHNSATGNFALSLSPANLTANRRWTFPDASGVIAGSAAGLTSGRVPFVTTGGVLTDTGNMTWDGTSFTLGVNASTNGKIKLNSSTNNGDGAIYADATYGIRMDTNGNALPIRIDGSGVHVSSTAIPSSPITGALVVGDGSTVNTNIGMGGGLIFAKGVTLKNTTAAANVSLNIDAGLGASAILQAKAAGTNTWQFFANALDFGFFDNVGSYTVFQMVQGTSSTGYVSALSTKSASSSITGAFVVGDGVTAATNVGIGGGNVNIGGGLTVAGASGLANVVSSAAVAGDYIYKIGNSSGTGLGMRLQAGSDALNALAVRNAAAAISFSVTGAGLITTGSATLMASSVALTNGAAASAGTLLNAPAAGNPTKWIPINDNGTTRYIPAW